MKKIILITKKTKSYIVSFNDNSLEIEPEVFLKYRLRLGKELEIKEYRMLLADNEYERFYKLGIKKLKKMMTQKELWDFLVTKGANQGIVRQLISNFTKRKYLDDAAYARVYLGSKTNSYGPKMIKNRLREKGIDKEIVDKLFIKYNEKEILGYLIPKKLKSIKNKSKKQTIQTVKSFFVNKGFSFEIIEQELYLALADYESDEVALIKKEYQKLIYKYEAKYEKAELKAFVKQKLYAKGFMLKDINKVIE